MSDYLPPPRPGQARKAPPRAPRIVFDAATGHDAYWAKGMWWERVPDPERPGGHLGERAHPPGWDLGADPPAAAPMLAGALTSGGADTEATGGGGGVRGAAFGDWRCVWCTQSTSGTAAEIAQFIVAHQCVAQIERRRRADHPSLRVVPPPTSTPPT